MDIVIREITSDDWQAFRRLRLDSLRDAPYAFRSTLADAEERTDESWQEMTHHTGYRRATTFIAWNGTEAVGMAYCRAEDGSVSIGAMWVAPPARRNGIGLRLLGAAIDFGRERGAGRAILWVTVGNEGAQQLYTAAGFTPTGKTEPLREGSDRTVAEMMRQL